MQVSFLDFYNSIVSGFGDLVTFLFSVSVAGIRPFYLIVAILVVIVVINKISHT